MVNVTLSMPDEIHRRMKQHPEIRWTHIMRKAVQEMLEKLESSRPEMPPPEERRMRGYPTRYKLKRKVFEEAPEVPGPDWSKLGD